MIGESGREVAVRLVVSPRGLTGSRLAGSHPRLFHKVLLQDGRSKWLVSSIGTRHFRPARPPSSTSKCNHKRANREPIHKRVAGLDIQLREWRPLAQLLSPDEIAIELEHAKARHHAEKGGKMQEMSTQSARW
jgi:hypothetical protein